MAEPHNIQQIQQLNALKNVAGEDAIRFAHSTETEWFCVCGTNNFLDIDKRIQTCSSCHRNRNFALSHYTKKAILGETPDEKDEKDKLVMPSWLNAQLAETEAPPLVAGRLRWTKLLAFISAVCILPLLHVLPQGTLLGPQQLSKASLAFLEILFGGLIGLIIDLVRMLPRKLLARRVGLILCSVFAALSFIISIGLPQAETARVLRNLVQNFEIAYHTMDIVVVARALVLTKNATFGLLVSGLAVGVVIGGLADLISWLRRRSVTRPVSGNSEAHNP